MKKTLLVFGLFLATTLSINAQDIADNSIGLRLGGNDGFGSEVTYQRKLEDNNRLEINLGLRDSFNDVKLTGLYEWVWSLENQFNWYAGAGAGIYDANKTSIFASGVVGVEYNFDIENDIPLLISLDYRPEIGITGSLDGLNSDFGLSVRYQF
ncbi:outer membrane insertion C-terminal signal [Polaribacter sp. KT25b]|uniref:hypothetical protein n=1 Tax=Polaribacter sp. KT25b TaxID=1855336 RepID=UPI00087D3868|nr:hypothetical protein [Polaribacter sp. KT25b]SDR72775.1 outer membrane insertion C-terminal signal [Polaribacter sp. KT25b]